MDKAFRPLIAISIIRSLQTRKQNLNIPRGIQVFVFTSCFALELNWVSNLWDVYMCTVLSQ